MPTEREAIQAASVLAHASHTRMQLRNILVSRHRADGVLPILLCKT